MPNDNHRLDPAVPALENHAFFEYFDYQHQPFRMPPELASGEKSRHPVCIAGGGPVGLAVALDLAGYGIRSVVIEDGDTLSYGSRAGCISRRSLDIFDRIGVARPFMEKGLPWTMGFSYYRDAEVLRFSMPDDDRQKFPPMINLPQNFMEQYLFDAVSKCDLIEVRWQQKVTGVDAGAGEGVAVDISTPSGAYRLHADWLIAADGARSTVRKSMGLKLHGESYQGRYLIADIRLDSKRPAGRLAWFDPPSNPGSTILMHKLTDEIWRFDYQLQPEDGEEEATDPERVSARIAAHLKMIGETGSWELSWISIYKANALTLEHYRHGRVLFAGDAAHPIPIFGVRGLNSGIDDAHNLAWKLALAIRGIGGDRLLDSFSIERTGATAENLRNAKKSTVFMSPPSPAYTLMRSAVLSLVISHPWLNTLINPRQSAAIHYQDSPLSSRDAPLDFDGGPRPGEPMAQIPIRAAKGPGVEFLTEAVGRHFLAIWFCADGKLPADLQPALERLQQKDLPFRYCVVTPAAAANHPWVLADEGGIAASAYGIRGSGLYLVRPDGYVAARWIAPTLNDIDAALRRAAGKEPGDEI
ncbi:MAG: FAD-dependent monooxygenase [Pseudomonadota bacterium]